MEKILHDVNGSGPVLLNNQSPIRADILLSEINAQEVRVLFPVIFFYALILFIGIVGNILVLLVYSFRYKRSPARVYILFLATIDFSICLFGLPYHLIDLTHPYTFTNVAACKSLTFIVTTLFHMSIFGLIVIAIDRYLKICHPLGKLQLSYFGRRRACATAVVAAFALSWPQLILYGPSEMESPIYNISGYACFIDTYYLVETNYPFIYIMSTLVICVGSTVFLIIAYSLICREIYVRYKNTKAQYQNGAADDVSVTEEVSLKSYTLPMLEKLRTTTTLISNSSESLSKDANSSKINIYINPYVDTGDTNAENDIHKTEENTSKLDNGIQYQLLPQSDNITDEHSKPFCISRQRSFSLDGYDFQKAAHLSDEIQNYGVPNVDKIKRTSDSSAYYSKSSNDSSVNELCSKQSSVINPAKELKKKESSNRLELPYRNLLTKQSSMERRHSEHCIKRHQRSMSMGVGQSNLLTRQDGLRIHTGTHNSSNSIARSSQGTVVSHKNPPKQHTKITKIMLTITIVFVLSYTPAIVITIYAFVREDFWDVLSVHETVVCEFFLRFYLVNNICNPFIYGFWDKRFKREIIITLKKLFSFGGKCEKCYESVPFDSIWKTKA